MWRVPSRPDAGTPHTVSSSGVPTLAPGEGVTMRTEYGAATSSAGLKIQLATRAPAPQSTAMPPAMRRARRRTAKTRSPPPKMSSASAHWSGSGRLLTMCAITLGSVRPERR